uniref:Retrotransposon gag domain-containing protein n=1 Tax=Fagus sylvatica TaxID=28930 RepID=A0A2N9GKH5_FAGSY
MSGALSSSRRPQSESPRGVQLEKHLLVLLIDPLVEILKSEHWWQLPLNIQIPEKIQIGTYLTRTKKMDALLTLKLEDGESIKDYATRFWETYNDIDNCSEDVAVRTFKSSLPLGTRLPHLAPFWSSLENPQEQSIYFSNSDLKDVQLPHNDPLVVTLRIENFDVKRILIAQGSFIEVMYQDLYEKLGLGEKRSCKLRPTSVRFFGGIHYTSRKNHSTSSSRTDQPQTEFIVVRASSPYNTIMGRDWLHRMKAVPSTLDQKLRFPTDDGIMELNGDQVAANTMCVNNYKTSRPRESGACRGFMTITAIRP